MTKQNLKTFAKKYWVHAAVLGLAMMIGGVMAARLGQDINFDLLNYHYHNPYALLHGRVDHDIAVGELEAYMNPLPDIPGFLLISNFSPRQAAFGLGLIQGINIFLIFEIALLLLPRKRIGRLLRIGTALFVGVLSFFGAGNLGEVGNTMGDNLASLFVLGALFLLLLTYVRPNIKPSPRVVRLAAYFVVGAGMGLKLTSVIYALALGAAGLLVDGSIARRIKETLLHGLVVAAGMLVTAGFWLVWLWQMFRSPLYPFYNAVFHSPYYPAKNFEDIRWVPKSLLHAVFAPFYYASRQALSSEVPFRDPRLAVAYVAAAGLVGYFVVNKWLLKKKQPLGPQWSRVQAVFWIFVVVSFMVWVSKFSYYRYLMPIELLALVAIATALFTVIRRFAVAAAVLVVLAAVITWQTIPLNWGRTPWRPTYFGVTHATFAHTENAAVLIPGLTPFGFAVPYFPESTQAIRIESDLSSPTMGTPLMQQRLREAVERKKQQGAPFYALRADEEAVHAELTLNQYGFKSESCDELPVYVREASPMKLRLCKLTEL